MTKLSKAQQAALDHFAAYARSRKAAAQATTAHILRMSDIAPDAFAGAVAAIKTHARIALHFHPDRPDPQLQTVAEALLESGVYKSQFETGLSNGSVSAVPGGERDLWEQKLFGGAYTFETATIAERPKYGALDLMLHPDGPAPRFGSCYFLLAPSASWRCTFTYLDSHQHPPERGTLDEFDDVLAALLSEVFLRDWALGEPDLTPQELVPRLTLSLGQLRPDPSKRAASRNLNHYIEAQVHGDVLLDRDVETLVADPSFRGTATEALFQEMAQRYGFDLVWHAGFALAVDDVPRSFRGPTMPSLAKRLSPGEFVDVSMIGPAVFDLRRNPERWCDRGSPAEVLQELKILWHVLVKFGRPRHEF